MEPYIYISLEAEYFIILCHRLLFGFSSFFNAVATLCLFKQAPEMQTEIKFYLYYMQVLIFLSDFILDVAVEPLNLLPLFGGYCKGFVCEWISIKHTLILTFLILCNIAFCIISCIFIRHQALVSGLFKFKNLTNQLLRLGLFTILCAPLVYGALTNFDESESDALIELYGMTWMQARGPSVIYKRTHNIAFLLPLFLSLAMFFSVSVGITLFVHTIRHIYLSTLRSVRSMKRLSNALKILSIQLCLPMALISLPSTLFLICIMDNSATLSFEVCYACVFMVNTHSIFHSLVLLTITPAYRRFIHHFCLRLFCRTPERKRKFGIQINSKISIIT